ncbi:MAG: 16S rRNA (cytosine(1402)-N(4))-methyltransferase RsmH [Betaproteobacteria bacterium]|nr:16S rRNA (cytosine(1402)-N(4))-methyltransferase RsmH [Betaproteobacteria bacterium]
MATTEWAHTTVMLKEAVEALDVQAEATYVDTTFGRGGHAKRILEQLSPKGRLIVFDKDPQAIAVAQSMNDHRVQIRHQGFAALNQLPPQSVAGVLMDLGVSSPQIDNPERGFSFRQDGPLDMRMDTSQGQSVHDWLVAANIDQIAQVIRDYGEERFANGIAKAIVARRELGRLPDTTLSMAELVATVVKTREAGQNPATRTFQAFRIFINRELEELEQALHASLDVLQPGGRLVVISFHSLEDRMVKQFIAQNAKEVYDRRQPFAKPAPLKLRDLGRHRPHSEEVTANPRSRSAIMRVAERLDIQGAV